MFSSGYVIGGTTPIGDVRGEETGYAFQGSPTVYGLDAEVLYSGALYAVYSAGGTDKLTGKVGIGTTAGDFTNNGYYAGSFTTRDNHNFETVLDVDTGNLNLTGLGSGVYTIGEQVTLQTSLVDRIGESLTTVSSITNDSFVKSLKISILDEDRNLIYDGYKTNYTNPSFTFTKQENIDIFGSFTKNFGVRFTVENEDGETHDTDFLLYGNRLSIDKIYVSASGGTFLDENPDNDYGPPTGSISLGSERTEALEGFSHRLINTSGTTGAINFNITFDQTPNFTDYDNLLIFAKTGTSVFDTTTENLLGTFPLSQLKNQNIRVAPDDGIEEGEANFFKFVGSSKVGFYDELFTVGPYTIQPIQVGEDPILYNVGDQEIVSGNLSILGDGAGGLYALGASGTGAGNRLTGPGNLPYLLTGDAGTEADTLQTVTDRGSSTTNAISTLAITGTAGLNQFKGSTADASASTIIARNSSNASLFSIRNDGRVDIPVGPVNIGNNLYLDNNEIWAQNSNNLNVKADGLIRIQPQSYGTAATFATNGNVGIGAEATTPLAKLDVRGAISGSGDFLGTGVGDRITLNGTGYLLSGEASASTDDLQAVTDRGKSTSNKIGIGTDSTYAPYNYLEVYGAAQIQDRTTSSDGTIQLGDQTNQTITYSSSEEALKLGAGISNLDFGFGGTVGIGSSNSIVIAAPGGVTISGGSPSTGSFVGGGTGHAISGHYDSIVAGSLNKISGGNLNFIGGGSGNDVNYSRFSSSLGGKNNDISGADFSVLLGGNTNLISGGNAHVIGGGDNNQISGDNNASTIVGGTQNKILSNTYSFIGAGATNTIYANNSVIGGGTSNIASGDSSVVFGGSNNQVLADYGVAAGRYSKVQAGHSGAFVLSDANTGETLSSGANTLTLNFKSGVYVDTDSGIYINGNPVLTGASGFEGDTLQTVTDRGATTTNAISILETI